MTVNTDGNAMPAADHEQPVFVMTQDDRVSLMLSWAHDFGLIDWLPDGDGGFTFVKKQCCDHACD